MQLHLCVPFVVSGCKHCAEAKFATDEVLDIRVMITDGFVNKLDDNEQDKNNIVEATGEALL